MTRFIRPTNRNARLLVGLLLAGLFCVQCTQTEAFKQSNLVSFVDGKTVGTNSKAVQEDLEKLARTDHVALLEQCMARYEGRVRSYTCNLVKQERLGGRLNEEQEIAVKFLESPFSVAMKWTRNAPIGDQIIYVEGKYSNNMLVKPKGLLGALVGTVLRKPDGADAMKNTLRPVNLFGFKRGLHSLLEVYALARQRGESKESFGGHCEVAGRPALMLVRYLPNRPEYPAKRTNVYIDAEYMLPICIEGYDWDDQLACRYVYKDIQMNVALDPKDFTPSANGMADPK
ncbi:MAG: hypothetical protein BWX88_00953 [Planctomycetes bacterium ADurb.Bin126]|nr:MAG: hypothetical protein BWX88_00953 [Planctomycetes bacterium ADurb.Bin126]HOD81000.1 DUF1571 domain-containing protein [Phycisphaerae bacterium]HQL73319.1 DUF1571 domain-containing protein [Phycisphaerae bacterium]